MCARVSVLGKDKRDDGPGCNSVPSKCLSSRVTQGRILLPVQARQWSLQATTSPQADTPREPDKGELGGEGKGNGGFDGLGTHVVVRANVRKMSPALPSVLLSSAVEVLMSIESPGLKGVWE